MGRFDPWALHTFFISEKGHRAGTQGGGSYCQRRSKGMVLVNTPPDEEVKEVGQDVAIHTEWT